jgi:hypothetical protein
MKVNGVERPWWWNEKPLLFSPGLPAFLLVLNLLTFHLQHDGFHLALSLFLAAVTAFALVAAVLTRRRLAWERKEF